MDINIESQIVVKTAAAWAVDATVYSNKRILVTSDSFWTGTTDSRKFKIADGIQTWVNIEYPPIGTVATPTLEEVLTEGNSTGGLAITSPDGNSNLVISSGDLSHTVTDGIATTTTVQTRPDSHTVDSVAFLLTQQTPSRVAIIDGSQAVVSANTATYPSLTELAFVKGVTSAIQTQLNAIINAPKIKSGIVAFGSFSGSPKKATVTFGAAFADANYSISIIGINNRVWTVESVVAGSFIINSNSGTAPTGNTYWTCVKNGEN